MLYQKNSSRTLDKSLFQNPTSEYRGTPFWAWNCKLDKERLERQIGYFKEMGLGGFHMHSRTGMATEYLSDEFMDIVRACVEKAEKEQMLAWLYDEDRWPSGAAGGLVTRNPGYRVRKLIFTPEKRTDCVSKEIGIETGKPYFVASYDIVLNEKGELSDYQRIPGKDDTNGSTAKVDNAEKGNAGGDRWYAYVTTNDPNPWFNNQTYADTLNKEAIDRFIEVTYERYKGAVGDKFGSIVPAIFTDEPQFERKTTLDFATDKTQVRLPWTNDVADTFQREYGFDLLDYLPELIWELPDQQVSKARYLYHDHIAERFASAFADNCGKWCGENGILFTGHMMAEETLESQTSMLGEAMRSYRSFQLPGIDMLCNRVELTTAKQAQSASHQYGREGVLSELYGVTNWDFDFRGHKFQGDWQAALGITVRVQHLAWVSMAGEAKRDYPASISYQSPWYKEYSYVEDHFARLNTVLTRGKPVVRVGVIHPVESYWLHWGPKNSTATIREQLNTNFVNITSWLLQGQVDFDFISESLLPDLCPAPSNPLKVGKMEYGTILVAGCETLRKSTVDRLCQFRKNGGRLLFVGECPKYVDAVKCADVENLYKLSEKIPFDHASALHALEEEKVIDIRNSNGTLTNNLIYNMRRDNDCKWLFIAHSVNPLHVDAVSPQKIVLTVFGEYTPRLYQTIDGTVSDVDFRLENGNTIIPMEINCHDSILLRLGEKTSANHVVRKPERQRIRGIDFKRKVSYTRSEANVLLLDTAQYAFDDGPFHDTEEILRIDNAFRAKLGYPSREARTAQPWVLEPEAAKHHVTLKFAIASEIAVEKPFLAIEDAEKLAVTLNDTAVEPRITGYYVDEAIKTIELPAIRPGKNTLTVRIPFSKAANVEYCYILGDFNVKVEGCEKTVTAPTDRIGFSSITNQGLPFYGGNITYQAEFEVEPEDCTITVKANNYRGSLIRVALDGEPAGIIAYAPYQLTIEGVKSGRHTVAFTLFGNRYNTFAALHNADTANTWHGPNAWRSKGDAWCYEYKLKDTGILASPVIEVFK